MDILNYRDDIKSLKISRLMSDITDNMFANILCPWVCPVFVCKCVNVDLYIFIQKYLRESILVIPNDRNKCLIVKSFRKLFL